MQTGKFTVDFFVSHPADWCYNAINQQFWLQYYKDSNILHPDQSSETHLVRPYGDSDPYTIRNNLVRARSLVHLLHEDTFIHGPFDFDVVNNHKTCDRISQEDWDVWPSSATDSGIPYPALMSLPIWSMWTMAFISCLTINFLLRCSLPSSTISHATMRLWIVMRNRFSVM